MQTTFKRNMTLAFLLCLCSAGVSKAQSERIFYYVNHPSSYESLKAHARQISIVAPQIYKLAADGEITGAAENRMLELARQNNIDVMPLVVNPGFDAEIIHAFLEDSTAQTRAVVRLMHLCETQHFVGMQFDFENIRENRRALLTAFIRRAARAFHKAGLVVSLAVFPGTADSPDPTAYGHWYFEHKSGAYDFKALAEHADFLSVMTYDQHSQNTPPGPVAGLPWIKSVLQYLLTQIEPAKISLGIPVYSYHWFATATGEDARAAGKGMSHQNAQTLIGGMNAKFRWDEDQGVTFSKFENHGLYEYLYLEDARSFAEKLQLVRTHRLRGFSVWRLGLEDPEIWSRLSKLKTGAEK